MQYVHILLGIMLWIALGVDAAQTQIPVEQGLVGLLVL